MCSDEVQKDLLEIYRAALDAVNGRRCVSEYLELHPENGSVYIISIGKAAISMMEGAMDVLGGQIVDALLITKKGYATPMPWTVYEGGHPVPDVSSLVAGEALLGFVNRLPLDARVLVLLSGGASAIVEVPANGVELQHIVELNQCLLQSGMDISQCNKLRQRLSRIKAGGLADLLAPRFTKALVISDVANDDAFIIGSGPLTPSTITHKAYLPSGLSDDVMALLDVDIRQDVCESDHIEYRIIANLEQACRAAAAKASELGYYVIYDSRERLGQVEKEAKKFVQQVLELQAGSILVCGGEPVIHLPEDAGRGGRCQHFALTAARFLDGQQDVCILAGATDGSDGPGEDAGALVDGTTCQYIQSQGVDIQNSIDAADSGRALDAAGALLSTGPTGSNVRDIFIGLRAR